MWHFLIPFLAQATPSPEPDWTWLTSGGSIGILALIVICFIKGWIVPGSAYNQVRMERDRALEAVYKQAEIAQRALEALERRSQ